MLVTQVQQTDTNRQRRTANQRGCEPFSTLSNFPPLPKRPIFTTEKQTRQRLRVRTFRRVPLAYAAISENFRSCLQISYYLYGVYLEIRVPKQSSGSYNVISYPLKDLHSHTFHYNSSNLPLIEAFPRSFLSWI